MVHANGKTEKSQEKIQQQAQTNNGKTEKSQEKIQQQAQTNNGKTEKSQEKIQQQAQTNKLECRVAELEKKYSELEEETAISRKVYYLIALSVLCFGGYWVYKRMRSNIMEEEQAEQSKQKKIKNNVLSSEMPANKVEALEDTPKTKVIETPKAETVVEKTTEGEAVKGNPQTRQEETNTSEVSEAPSELPNIPSSEATQTESGPTPSIDRDWIVLYGSQIGASHIASKLPCQDNSAYKDLGKGWGICVVSDGAGFASHSHYGSKAVCHIAVREIENFIRYGKYMDSEQLPTDDVWQKAAVQIFGSIKRELGTLAASYGVEFKALSATCMIAVYSPYGVLSTHIGDGRGGCHPKGSYQWSPLFTPHKGEEANQTLFVTSPWESLKTLGGVPVPESVVYLGEVEALCLLSDGMEKATFECAVWNDAQQRYEDLNRPSVKIFSQLVSVVRENIASGETYDKLQERWMSYLQGGTSSIKRESDDKTMLLAVRFN